MSLVQELRDTINNFIDSYLKANVLKASISCTVKSVSGDSVTGLMTCDCAPIDGTAIIEDVQLCANFNNDTTQAGFLLIPTVGSIVTVSFKSKTDAFVSMVSVVDKIYINGNDYGGLVEVNPLVTKLNNLENAVNKLIGLYDAHVHTGGTISGSTGVPTTLDTDVLIDTVRADLENTLVVHGEGNLT